jgi:antirestriction protein ArdC
MAASIHETVSGIIAAFERGDIPEAIAYSMFPIAEIPSSKWSLLNRTVMFLSGTQDARGYRQWKQVGRYVKKGSKAIYILVPRITKTVDSRTGEEETMLKGFVCKPVFRVEDTDGDPLEYKQIELPDFPLIEKAKEWGIAVKAIPGNYRYWGYYSLTGKEICLATDEEAVFFHELAHAAHDRVKGGLQGGQNPLQEIVAELSAAALCRMVGKQPSDRLGNAYRYIKKYAEKIGMTPHGACLKVMAETEKVLALICPDLYLKTALIFPISIVHIDSIFS